MSKTRACCGTLPEFSHRDTCMHNPSPKKAPLETTMNQRGSDYGEFSDIANLTQGIMNLIDAEDEKNELKRNMNNTQREAMHMIVHKIARIAVGDANHKDSWHDIQGYAKLVEDRIK